MNAYIQLTRAGLRGFFRNRQGVFWSFFFPLFFIFIFGTIFGGKKEGPQIHFKIGVVTQDAGSEWVKKVFQSGQLAKMFTTSTGTIEVEKEALKKGERDAVIVFPKEMGPKLVQMESSQVQIFVDQTQPQTAQMVMGILQNVISGIEMTSLRNRFSSGSSKSDGPLLKVSQESLAPNPEHAKSEKMSNMDFLLPGIMAMTVMQLGLFTALPFINMREKGILKRLRATPLPRPTIIGSQVTQRLVIGVIQTSVILTVGFLFFKFHMTGSWPLLMAIIIFGVLTFISIGAILASVAKTQESGVSMVQLVNFPMMFLSGIFFPLQILPDGLRSVVGILPATHMASLMRHVMVDAPLAYPATTSIAAMAAWMIGALIIASRFFRWE